MTKGKYNGINYSITTATTILKNNNTSINGQWPSKTATSIPPATSGTQPAYYKEQQRNYLTNSLLTQPPPPPHRFLEPSIFTADLAL